MFRGGTGDPLVLLHGFTATWECWRPVLPALAARYDVVAPTLPGHAGGPPFEGAFTVRSAVDAVERQLDALGVGTAHLVGNSMGGMLALGLAQRGRARSVVGLSPAGGWDPAGPEPDRIAHFFARQLATTRRTRRLLPRTLAVPRVRAVGFRGVMERGQLVPHRDAVRLASAVLGCTVAHPVIDLLRARGPVLDGLADIDVPVLLAWAERDRVLPAATCSQRLREGIPGAEFRILPTVGHVPTWDDPALVVDTITGWVAAHV